MKGVIANLVEVGDTELKLNFYDASTLDGKISEWQSKSLFTNKLYKVEQLQDLKLTQEQYAEIGENLILRLLALNGKNK